ncbi:MAG: hypothetical protein EXR98_23485 [Gemmataceae bacterium]|nr:hypothetical protein [Gemmataceae bacterium]
MAKSILSQDNRGGFKRDLGRTRDGKQRRFYLGHDKAQAQRRSETLERLWELVEDRWEGQRKHHAMLEEKWQQEIERGEWEDNMATLDTGRINTKDKDQRIMVHLNIVTAKPRQHAAAICFDFSSSAKVLRTLSFNAAETMS